MTKTQEDPNISIRMTVLVEEAFIEVSRPVVFGAETFLDKARHVGGLTVSDTFHTSVTGLEVVGDRLAHVQHPVPRMGVELLRPSELRAVLLRRGINAAAHRRSQFNGPAVLARYIRPGISNEQSLVEELEAIRESHGLEPDEIDRVNFSAITPLLSDEHGTHLGLITSGDSKTALALQQQAGAASQRLIRSSQSVGLPTDRWSPVSVAFCRVTPEVTASYHEYERLLQGLGALLPVTFGIGGIQTRAKTRSTL